MTDMRVDYLTQMNENHDPGWEEQFKPGTMGCHEALHTASVVVDLIDRSLLSHPAVVANPEWFALAEKAFQGVYDLYQAIGAEHIK